jgi:hypothetical protein
MDILYSIEGFMEDADAETPTECRAYRALLATTIAMHSQEYATVCYKMEKTIERLKSNVIVTMELQMRVLLIKNKISSHTVKIKSYVRMFRELSGDDDDQSLMNLTWLKHNPHLYR